MEQHSIWLGTNKADAGSLHAAIVSALEQIQHRQQYQKQVA